MIRAKVKVDHDERCVEYHDLQGRVSAVVESTWDRSELGVEFEELSCEAIARQVGEALLGDGLAVVSVSVFEDDENGSEVEWS